MSKSTTEAVKISKLAHSKGYATRVKDGKVQFVTVEYDNKGKSTVNEITDYLTLSEAIAIING